MQKVIESERLILRPWEQGDVQAVQDGLNDFDVAKNLLVPFPYTLEDAKSFINSRIQNQNTREKCYFAIVEKSSGKVIGGTNIAVDENNVAHGGIWFNKKYHGKGYGTEAMKLRNAYSFDELKVAYLDNGFLEGNDKSWNMQQKVGYKLTGETDMRNCPARGGQTKEYKTKLIREDFIR